MIRRILLAVWLACAYLPAQAYAFSEQLHFFGTYVVECRRPDGSVRWRERIHNVVTTVGKDLMLDTAFSGSSYTVTGPFAGLISGDSFTGVAASDTMASHSGWLEAGSANDPTYISPRKTIAFNAAASGQISTSSPFSFSITSVGSIRGIFILYGTGAVSTIDDTNGVLYSASVFTTSHTVAVLDTVNVSYTTGM